MASLARALRLTETERDHLYLLAGQAPPTTGRVSRHVPPSVQRLLDQLQSNPLSVHDAAWNLIACNRLWAALMGDPSGWRGKERNIAWRYFTHLPTRVTHTPEQQTRLETAFVCDLRSSSARYPNDAHLAALITSLRSTSERFDDLWASHAVGFHTTDTKTVNHPDLGSVTVDCDTLTVPGNDLRIAICSAPPATTTADQFTLLGTIGTQTLT
ncbi:transcriptional regulator [Streptomyces sp. NPDC005931]|uniref:MmyB family transcriptional regulator n=1 Tax=Streptomyces sp. NPDC005931 TaxID=3364737 RepID=UPI00367EA42E